jgi:hypothetical protein
MHVEKARSIGSRSFAPRNHLNDFRLLLWSELRTATADASLPASAFQTHLGTFGKHGTNVIPLSDSANLDAVVAHTRGDETVREAVSVFIDHAKTLIEQGGPMALLCARPKDLLAAVDNPTRPSASVPKSTAAQTKKSKTTKKEDTMTQTSATQQGSSMALRCRWRSAVS